MISSSPAIDALWLDTLNRICGRAAHELKGVLNGVAVNLEVVRSRASKPEVAASAIASYANAAASQFDAVMDMTEGLLSLARPVAGPLDVGQTIRRIAALLGPVARVDGRELIVDASVDAIGTISADSGAGSGAGGNAARVAIGAAMLAAIESVEQVTCRAAGHAVELQGSGDAIALPSDEVIVAVREAGIELRAERSAIIITFPR